MFSSVLIGLSVCLFVVQQNYSKRYELFFMNLGGQVERGKNPFNFSGNPHSDPGISFHFMAR